MSCRAFVSAVVIALGACSDAEQGGGAGTAAGTGDQAGGSDLGAYEGYQASVRPLLTQACNCHQSEPMLAAPFSLKVGEAHGNLVGVPSMQVPSMNLVEPGDPDRSYLWHKVAGTQLTVGGEGDIMPPTIPLFDYELAIVEAWILAGAPP